MSVFEELQFSAAELRQLNRVRLHQQVLFLSDVLCVKGTKIDLQYMVPRDWSESWSKLEQVFPAEEISTRDLKRMERRSSACEEWGICSPGDLAEGGTQKVSMEVLS